MLVLVPQPPTNESMGSILELLKGISIVSGQNMTLKRCVLMRTLLALHLDLDCRPFEISSRSRINVSPITHEQILNLLWNFLPEITPDDAGKPKRQEAMRIISMHLGRKIPDPMFA